MGDFHASGRDNVADRVGVRSNSCIEFKIDCAAGGVEVGFPAGFDILAAQRADFLVQYSLPLSTNLVCVFRARRRDDFALFIDPPVQTPYAPAPLDVLEAVVDDTCHLELDGEIANGMDGGWEDDAGGEVCGGEDADGGFVVAGLEGALDGQGPGDSYDVGHVCEGFGVEEVVDVAKGAVRGGGYVAWEEVGEGEGVAALFVFCRLREEFPLEEFGVFMFAGGAVFGDGFFECDSGH